MPETVLLCIISYEVIELKDTTQVITATELKENLGKYIDYVSGDNEVIVTKNGKKIIRITPYISEIERYFTVRERAMDYQYGGKKVSYEEFLEISEKTDLRMEYINGEIVLLASPNPFHQDISGNLYVLLRNFLQESKCRVYYAPFDVHLHKIGLNTPDVIQPDLLVACDLEENLNEKGRYMGTPSLCIEILSASTRSKDMVDKLNTFMLSGVNEFWIVDPKNLTVMIYTFDNYVPKDHYTYRQEEILVSQAFPGLEIAIQEVFAR